MSLAEKIVTQNFSRSRSELCIGGVAISDLAAAYGTPLYIYDGDIMRRDYARLSKAVAGFAEVYYSIKANPNPSIAALFVQAGAGLEIASGAEFQIARTAGCKPRRIIFAGPGKGEDELASVLNAGIGEVHLENFEEIEIISRIAQKLEHRVPVAIRINPSSEAQGGAMQMGGRASQFGFDEELIGTLVDSLAGHSSLKLIGLHFFAGTQILDVDVLLRQWSHSIGVAARLSNLCDTPLETIDLGGGLGVPYYSSETFLDLNAVERGVPALRDALNREPLLRDTRVVLEPGRFLTAGAGVYLVRVRAVKMSRGIRYVIMDGGMHQHLAASGNLGQVIKRDYPIVAAKSEGSQQRSPCVIVGPLCTPLDTLGRTTDMPELARGDLVAVLQSGAYGLTASPTAFLSHKTPVEVLVENGKHRAIRQSVPSSNYGID